MNRLAGYAYYEKKNPDYNKALSYMDELFKTVSSERILWKDYHYLARIIMKMNQNLPKLTDELENQQALLDKENERYTAATPANKAKLKPALDQLTAKVEALKADVKKGNAELDKGFKAYDKVLEYKPQDKGVLNEMYGYYYNFKRYNQAARTVARLIDPTKDDLESYMKVGRTFYTGGNYKAADSTFNIILKKDPNYVPGNLFLARTYSRLDPDYKTGMAKPKFEKLLSVAKSDSVKNSQEMTEGLEYLGYYFMEKGDFGTARNYYSRLVNLDPNDKETRIKGYNGLAQIELRQVNSEKTNEGKLAILGRAGDSYSRILAIDPINASAKAQIAWIHEYEANVKKGINPNEIKGTVKDAASGAPIAYASVRVKDTAAETMTNNKGEFKFEIPQGMETLIISAKGYQTKEIPITKSRVYPVTLEK